jgi:hypothetical protein
MLLLLLLLLPTLLVPSCCCCCRCCCAGHDLYGRGLVAWAMRNVLTRELTILSTNPGPARLDAAVEIAAAAPAKSPNNNGNNKINVIKPGILALALPKPVSPIAAREADGDTYCAEGAWFKQHVVKSSVTKDGWEWFDDGTPVNLKYCKHFNCRKLGYRATGAAKSLDILVRQRTALLLLLLCNMISGLLICLAVECLLLHLYQLPSSAILKV